MCEGAACRDALVKRNNWLLLAESGLRLNGVRMVECAGRGCWHVNYPCAYDKEQDVNLEV